MMIRKICNLFIAFGCLLSLIIISGCKKETTEKETISFSYKNNKIEKFEMVPYSYVLFNLEYIYENFETGECFVEEVEEIEIVASSKKFEKEKDYSFSNNYFNDFLFSINDFSVGKYSFDLLFEIRGEEKKFDFEFEVFESFDYIVSKAAENICRDINKKDDSGYYCDEISNSGFSSIIKVEDKNDKTLEISTRINYEGVICMTNIRLDSKSSFYLEYSYQDGNKFGGYWKGTYSNGSIVPNQDSITFQDFEEELVDIHKEIAADLLHRSLLNLKKYLENMFDHLVIVSQLASLGFDQYKNF